jgi:CRISPR-associated endonuclease/helicase Cas3
VWRGEQSRVIEPSSLRPGDTIVVPAAYGGIAHGNWSPASTEPVRDVAELAGFRQRGRPVLRLHPDVVRAGLDLTTDPPVPPPLDAEDVVDREVVAAFLEGARGSERESVSALIEALVADAKSRRLKIERLVRMAPGGEEEYFVIAGRRRRPGDTALTGEDDRSSFSGVEVPLARHLAGVRELAIQFAEALGLPPELAVDIGLAAEVHDVGKADARFQRLLNGGSEFKVLVQPEPLAKSGHGDRDHRARRRAAARSGYPPGSRHEVLSAALAAAAATEMAPRAADWQLVLHLIAAHHGGCRPFAPWTSDLQPVDVSWRFGATTVSVSSAHGLERLDSGVAERFWTLVRRYGWWGLAWLETVLRLADHRQSEREQRTEMPDSEAA